MKVNNIFSNYDIYSAQKPSQASKANRAEEKRDTVAISSHAKDYQALQNILSETPDIREDVVSAVKAKLESGNNPVTSNDIASKLVDKLFYF